MAYVWEWYIELKGAEPLSFLEIKSWSDLTNQCLKAWEVDLIRTLDRIYWRVLNSD